MSDYILDYNLIDSSFLYKYVSSITKGLMECKRRYKLKYKKKENVKKMQRLDFNQDSLSPLM